MVLSQVQCSQNPALLGRIVKLTGRKSAMVDLYRLDQARQRVAALDEEAYTTLRQPIEKLTGQRFKNEESFHKFIGDTGWDQLLTTITPRAKSKPGSAKDLMLKSVQKFTRDRLLRQEELKRCEQLGTTDTLDAAQRQAIAAIRAGQSVLLGGPPGSGKTHCALYTLDIFGLSKTVLYVSPTAELALQAFANLKETFGSLAVGIVTPLLAHVPPQVSVLVGTPQEMWSYLRQSPLAWEIAILDEIHTISDASLGYSDALQYLMMSMQGEAKQVIALSATIRPSDLERLRAFLARCAGLEDVLRLDLDPSPVPRKNYYIGDKGLRAWVPGQSPPTVEITPDLLFRCFRQLGLDGTLVFAENDLATWNLFTGMLSYLDSQNDVYYGRVRGAAEEINHAIDESLKHKAEIRRIEMSSTATVAKVQTECGHHRSQMAAWRDRALARLHEVLKKELRIDASALPYKEKVASGMEEVLSSLEEGRAISIGAKAVLQSLVNANEEDGIPESLPLISTFFQFRGSRGDVEHKEFDAFLRMHTDSRTGKMRINSDSQAEWSAINNLVALAEAEGLTAEQVRPIIQVTVRALQYGVALMMPSLPFVVTHTIRRYLNERRIPYVFSTHDMAMGINYGLRNVVILDTGTARGAVSPSLLVQMAGRAGRRGLDTDARIVYGNITPVTRPDELEELTFPEPLYAVDSEEARVCSLYPPVAAIGDEVEIIKLFRKVHHSVRRRSNMCNEALLMHLLGYEESHAAGQPYQLPGCFSAEAVCFTFHLLRGVHLAGLQLDLQQPSSRTIEKLVQLTKTLNQTLTRACFRK